MKTLSLPARFVKPDSNSYTISLLSPDGDPTFNPVKHWRRTPYQTSLQRIPIDQLDRMSLHPAERVSPFAGSPLNQTLPIWPTHSFNHLFCWCFEQNRCCIPNPLIPLLAAKQLGLVRQLSGRRQVRQVRRQVHTGDSGPCYRGAGVCL